MGAGKIFNSKVVAGEGVRLKKYSNVEITVRVIEEISYKKHVLEFELVE